MRARILVLLLVAFAATAGCLQTFEDPVEPHYVRIVNVELSPERVLSQQVVLNVTTVLDNRGGGETGELRLRTKAFSEETGFLLAENETTLGVIPGETTRSISMRLPVPREGSVRIDASVFENDLGLQSAGVVARNLGTLEPEVVDTGLRIRDADFIIREVAPGTNRTGQRATIQTNLYVTNEGDLASEDLMLQVKAREISTRLISDEQWTSTGVIAPGATVVRSLNLTVPEGYNYAFETLTWRGQVIVARSEGVVRLAPTYVKPADQEVVTEKPNVRDFLSPTTATPTAPYAEGARGATPAPQVPGFDGPLALAAGVLAAAGLLLVHRRRSR